MRQIQKLRTMGQLTTEVVHEINNPLTMIIDESSMFLEDRLETMVMDGVAAVHRAGLQARDISECFKAAALDELCCAHRFAKAG